MGETFMSMNEVYNHMGGFCKELQGFNEQLRRGYQQVKQHHEQVNPLWQDDMRRDYDRKYNDLDAKLGVYIGRTGEEYQKEMNRRLDRVGRYLHGN